MTTPPKVLFLGPIFLATREWKAAVDAGELELIQLTNGTPEQFHKDLKAGIYDGVRIVGRTESSSKIFGPFDDATIALLPESVKYITHGQAGYDSISIPACTARGILVSHAPGGGDQSVADTTMFLLLGAARHMWPALKSAKAGHWRSDGLSLGHGLTGKTLGILGMGGIGTAVAERALGFGMKVIYHNHHPVGAEHLPYGGKGLHGGVEECKYVSFDELLGTSDAISLHLPLNEETRHEIDAAAIDKMKHGVVLVNAARGAVVDEEALIAALKSGKVFGAGWDVFEAEPEIRQDLRELDNAFLTPHIGSGTFEATKDMELLVLENARSALKTGKLLTLVREQRELI